MILKTILVTPNGKKEETTKMSSEITKLCLQTHSEMNKHMEM